MGFLGLGKKDKSSVVKGAIEVVKGVRLMIDEGQFTKEEAAKLNIEAAQGVIKFNTDTMNESTDRSQARRTIAVHSLYFFYFLIIALMGMWKFDQKWYEASLELILAFKLPTAFIMIMAFFFGGYYIKQFIGRSKKKEEK